MTFSSVVQHRYVLLARGMNHEAVDNAGSLEDKTCSIALSFSPLEEYIVQTL